MISSAGYANNSAIFASATKKAVAGHQASIADAVGAAAKDSVASSQSTAAAAPQAGISTYDFTNMTQHQMQGIARDLTKSGKIDLTLCIQSIGVIPLGESGPNNEYRLPTAEQSDAYYNRPINYLQKLQDMMSFLEQRGEASDPKSGYENMKNILATLQKMQGTTSGVNITA